LTYHSDATTIHQIHGVMTNAYSTAQANLDGAVSYGAEMYLNLLKRSTGWLKSSLKYNLTLDADGYPTSTPPAGAPYYLLATWNNIDYPTGTYELDWDGDPNARFSFQGAVDPSSVKVAPGRITFNVPSANTLGIQIDLWSQDVGNHIHNMSLYLQD